MNYSFDTAWGEAVVPRSPRDIALDENGRIYVADSFNDVIYQFDPLGILFNTWETGLSADGSSHPIGVAIHPNQEIYVLMSGVNRVVVLGSNGEQRTTWEGTTDEKLGTFDALAIDRAGAVYIASSATSQIHKFDSSGKLLLTWEVEHTSGELASPIALATYQDEVYVLLQTGPGVNQDLQVQRYDRSGSLVREQVFDEMHMKGPGDLTISEDGSIYVLETPESRVHRFELDGSHSSTWGERGTEPGQFTRPTAIVAGKNDDVLVADTGNQRVQRMSTKGGFKSQIKIDGPMRFGLIGDIAYTQEGHLIAYDPILDRVQAFDESGSHLNTWKLPTSTGLPSFEGGAIAADSLGTIYIADGDQSRIYQLRYDQGSFTEWDPATGEAVIGTSALATDATGNVYIADRVGNRIIKFTSAGEILIEWNHDDRGLIDNPTDIAIAGNSVYVLDSDGISLFDLEGHVRGTIIAFEGSTEAPMKRLDHIDVDQSGRIYAIDIQARQAYVIESGTVLNQWSFERNSDNRGPSAGSGIAVGTDEHLYIVNPSRPQILVFASR